MLEEYEEVELADKLVDVAPAVTVVKTVVAASVSVV